MATILHLTPRRFPLLSRVNISFTPAISQGFRVAKICIMTSGAAPAEPTTPIPSTSVLASLTANLPPLPHVPGTEPSRCILDSFRIAIAKIVSEALPSLTVEQVYAGVDYGKKGVDFTVALPRFRLKDKVDVLAKKVLDHVSLPFSRTPLTALGGSSISDK